MKHADWQDTVMSDRLRESKFVAIETTHRLKALELFQSKSNLKNLSQKRKKC